MNGRRVGLNVCGGGAPPNGNGVVGDGASSAAAGRGQHRPDRENGPHGKQRRGRMVDLGQ